MGQSGVDRHGKFCDRVEANVLPPKSEVANKGSQAVMRVIRIILKTVLVDTVSQLTGKLR
ncbi:uncharacterized protein N0V89_011700, partial [Didymosphaeria variabile]